MSKSILEEAMEDTKLLKETAIENAKNVLVEAISPKIKEFVETQIGESEIADKYYGGEEVTEAPEPEVCGDANMDLEGMYEAEDKEDDDKIDEAKDEDEKVEEVVEITNEDLKKAFSEILNTELREATVTKGFGDVQDPTPQTAGGKGEKGIADEKSGEHMWNDETAPAAKDWTVKEAWYKKQSKVLAGKLAKIQKENSEYKQACNHLKRSLQEVNLFNSKLLYTNKLLQNTELNNKQRIAVIEAFDRAQSQREVELVFKSISESLKIAGVLSEAKKSTLKGPKASRTVNSSGASALLKEGVENNGEETWSQHMTRLAGLVK